VHEFVTAIVEGRDPYPNARQSANWTCTGLLAHESGMHGGGIRKLLTAVENGGAGTVSRRSKMAAHNRAGLWAGRIGATAPITPPFRERHRSAQRHGDMERDTT
jgi:hypothetical protein